MSGIHLCERDKEVEFVGEKKCAKSGSQSPSIPSLPGLGHSVSEYLKLSWDSEPMSFLFLLVTKETRYRRGSLIWLSLAF